MDELVETLKSLTLNDIYGWAGPRVYDRGKSYIGHVQNLSRTSGDALVAWVMGSVVYATFVHVGPNKKFEAFCTCPYDGSPCKHAVAVVLAAAEFLKKKKSIPLVADTDPLCHELFASDDDKVGRKAFAMQNDDGEWDEEWDEDAEWDDDDDDDDDVDDDDDDDDDDDEDDEGDEEDEEWDEDAEWEDDGVDARKSRPRRNDRAEKPGEIESILRNRSKKELIGYLVEYSKHHSKLKRMIIESHQLKTGSVGKIVAALRKEIKNVTSVDVYCDHWRGGSVLPDYSHIQEVLIELSRLGHADEVVELGEVIYRLGGRQVENSHDEGESAEMVQECMGIVLKALPKTSMSPVDQMMWLIERYLVDEYELLGSVWNTLEDEKYQAEHWREVAGYLEITLSDMPPPATFSATYQREQVVKMLVNSYGLAGLRDKIIPLLEKEVVICHNFETLFYAYKETGNRDAMRRCCLDGYSATIKTYPGIASKMEDLLVEMAREEGCDDLVAAYASRHFFKVPSSEAFAGVRDATKNPGDWDVIREALMTYLETGIRADRHKNRQASADWPLPPVELPDDELSQNRKDSFPMMSTLIGIALLENRNDDAVALYTQHKITLRFDSLLLKKLATAVIDSHPDVSIGIWLAEANGIISMVKADNYPFAVRILDQIRTVYRKLGRDDEWLRLLKDIRAKHSTKRRLIAELKVLEGRKLVD